MNEHEQSPERQGGHAGPWLSIDQLGLTDSDPAIVALWDEGLARWGAAFAGYTTMRTPELHSGDVLANFEDLYLASYDSLQDVANNQLEALGWDIALEHFKLENGMSDDLIAWDIPALLTHLRLTYDIVPMGERMHLFAA